jgi:pyrimidine operon attenuation protein/uracil phosphoribosyltransferase
VQQHPEELIKSMAKDMQGLLEERGIQHPAMVGVHTGGVWVAERLRTLLGITDPLGFLDISFHRDDFSHLGMNPQVKPSHLPFDVDGRHIILVDDVLYTGRTVRAALNEIFDYGRPHSVLLAVLVDRGGRELPIEANVAGIHLQLGKHEHLKLVGPEPLQLVFQKLP